MKIAGVLLIMLLLISGCSNVKTYTYKKDRVDQDMTKGNKGVLKGEVPPAQAREGLTRTMVGTDVEIPVLPWEKKAEAPAAKPAAIKGETIKGETVEEEKAAEEEEFIK